MDERSQAKRISERITEAFGAEPERLWLKYPDYAVFRNSASGKWFAIIMNVEKSKLGLSGEGFVFVAVVKCEPVLVEFLQVEKGFLPAYHMNKKNWISVLLDESVDDERILALLEEGYVAVMPRRRDKAADLPPKA